MPENPNPPGLTCQELVELVTDYFEDALSEQERVRVQQHLAACSGCERYVEQIRQTVQALGTLKQEDLSPDAQAKLLVVFRDWHNS